MAEANPAPDPNRSQLPVALTGATGFIGTHLQLQLNEAGFAVRALTRSPATNLQPRTQEVRADLSCDSALKEALANSRAVVYLAGSVRGRRLNDFTPANVDGVANVARVLAEHYPETPLLLVSSLAASAPALSHYACSKALGEHALRQSALARWTILRPPAVYGDGDKELRGTFGAIRRGLVPMPGPAAQRIPFIEVTDLASAIIAWLGDPGACDRECYTIHDGHPDGYDWKTMADLLAPKIHIALPVPNSLLRALGSVNLAFSKCAGYAPMLTPGKARELAYSGWSCSNDAFTAATGWRPEVQLAEGVARLFRAA